VSARSLAINAAVAVAYYAAGKLGLGFSVVHVSVSPVWPASGLAIASMVLFGTSVWPGILAGALAVNFSASHAAASSLVIASGNTAEALVAWTLLDRFNGGRSTFGTPAEVLRFVLLTAVLATTVAATVGVSALYLFGTGMSGDFGDLWLTWWLGDAVGVVIVAPLILLWARDRKLRWTRQQLVEAAMLAVAIVVIGQVIFGGSMPRRLEHFPLDFLCIPLLVWVAFRFGQREAASAVLILSGIALSGTLEGYGPFAGNALNDSLLLLQTFLGLAAVLTIALAALVSDSRKGHEATALVASVFRSSNDAIVTKTLDGTITSWNPAAERLFGFTAEEAVGQNIRMIIPKEQWGEEDLILARIARGEVVGHFEAVRIRKDGHRVDISLTISPIFAADGRVIGASKTARDIGERKKLEDAQAALLSREQDARMAAEAGNRAKDEFLAILSHELRTPLNAVYGWARMLQTGKLDEETSARALEAIVRNANAQVQLIDDLLDVSRIISGKMRLDVRQTDVREVIEAAVDTVDMAASEQGVRVQRVLDPRGAIVNGDPVRLQQVVWNLVMNAVKFTPAGGKVDVELRRSADQVEVVVRDTGQGIAPHVLPYVFDRFRQWDSSSTRAHSGLGLGLALVKHLTELHHGTVTAESPGEGRGATFTVTLPLTLESRLVAGPAPTFTETALAAVARLDGLRVLVVDDDPDALELSTEILGRGGAIVKTCDSAKAALAALQEWRPDVLVSDIDMPGEDGYSLIRKVRALDEDRGGKTPAVALTAYGRAEDRVQTLSAGYSMHIPKPVNPEEFTAIVASVARVLRSPHRAT
jgi:PAS domain S-box-containing protein